MAQAIRRVFAALCVIAYMALMPANAWAEEREVTFDDGGASYEATIDTEALTATLTGLKLTEQVAELSLPSSIVSDGVTYTVSELSGELGWSTQCAGVTSLVIPETVTSVDGMRFSKFPDLTSLTIPGSVKNFNGSLQSMSKLQTLTFEEGVEEISSNFMVNNCSALSTVNLPSTLKRLSQPSTFENAISLTSITLPEGIQITEGSTFSGCTSLTSIVLPASIDEIVSSMFADCTALTTVEAKGVITSVGQGAFSGCTALTTIPSLSSVTSIGHSAFKECGALTGPIDLSQVTTLGSYAFYNCRNLTGDLDLGNVTSIPTYAFSYVTARVTALNPAITSIGTWGFVWTDLSAVGLPERLESIGSYGCYGADLPDPLEVPDGVTSLGAGAFDDTGLTQIVLGSSIETVNANVFPSTLKKLTINNSEDIVKIEGALPTSCKVNYTVPSLEDADDTIAEDGNALQYAVNAAASGEVIVLRKNVTLKAGLTIPAGKDITIKSDGETRYLFASKEGSIKDLIVVGEGAHVTFAGEGSGELVLFGRYNEHSVVSSQGVVTLSEGARVTRASISTVSTGVVEASGEGASIEVAGGVIDSCKVLGDAAYSAPVRVSDGASFIMTAGSIEQNIATDADPLNSSSGVLMLGDATGSMSGGAIRGNSGVRGAALMLFGNEDDARTTFTLSGTAQIGGNVCSAANKANVSASGAVHVESNATFTMDGGAIDGNRGGNGAGVCVVDGNLQNDKQEYKTAFVMNGGSISNNHGFMGAGVYSYTNGVTLNAGSITDNTATKMGGGVYSEGNYDHYSTLHMSNVLVTENTAPQGGGMWFCATGIARLYVSEGAAVFGNAAVEDGFWRAAGDDFVFSAFANDDGKYDAKVASRMLGGGAVSWMEDGRVRLQASSGVYPSVNPDVPRYGEEGASTEPIDTTRITSCMALKAVSTTDAQDLAKTQAKLIISGNTAGWYGGGVASNGGITVGNDEATLSVEVSKVWCDNDDAAGKRPESVTVHVLNGEKRIDTAVLSAANNWKATFTGLPARGAYSVVEDVPAGYQGTVTGNAGDGFVLTNTYVPSTTPDDGPDNPPTSPDEPDEPDTPDTPDEPDTPDTPDTPDEPDTPDTPDEPDTPDTPQSPNEPQAPDDSGDAEEPGLPKTGDSSVALALVVGFAGVAAIVVAIAAWKRVRRR